MVLKIFNKARAKPILGAVGRWQQVKYKLNLKAVSQDKTKCDLDLVMDRPSHEAVELKSSSKCAFP